MGCGASSPGVPDVMPQSEEEDKEKQKEVKKKDLLESFPKPPDMSEDAYAKLLSLVHEDISRNWTAHNRKPPRERVERLIRVLPKLCLPTEPLHHASPKLVSAFIESYLHCPSQAEEQALIKLHRNHKSKGLEPPPVLASRLTKDEATLVFVLGGPGCGKGTQCERMVRDFGFVHLSAGDLLRQEVQRGTDVGKALERTMKEGLLVPVEVTLRLLRAAMDASSTKRFLIDGFPRAIDQAEAFETKIGSPDMVLYFDCPLEEMEKRLLKRAETSGRSDDNIETIRKRFQTFLNQSKPVVDHYVGKGTNVQQISAIPSPDEVYASVYAALKSAEASFVPGTTAQPEALSPLKPGEASIVFVLGGPGCGKGTQCERIVRDFGFVHLSAGDLLREEVQRGTEVGQECERLMKEGLLVPVEITLRLLRKAMHAAPAKRFLVDGFPRAIDQAEAFEAKIGVPSMLLYLDCPLEEMEKRLLKRAETSGRSDDNIETIRKRFQTFLNQSKPVIDHYIGKGANVQQISAIPAPDEVYESVHAALKSVISTFVPGTVVSKNTSLPPPLKPGEATMVFVLGGPGCGKGTQCERMVRDFGFVHLSAGDLLREEVRSGTEVGQECERLMKEGLLVPVEVTLQLLRKAMDATPAKRFLIDGFPRAVDQAQAFETKIGVPSMVLYLECSLEEMEKRLLKRAETSGRSDDNIDTIRKRFQTFLNQSKPVIDYYVEKGANVQQVSSIPPPDEVYAVVRGALEAAESSFVPGVASKRQLAIDLPPPFKPEEASIVFVLGGPGCGKGTQCERMVRDFGFVHLSAGDLLREEVKRATDVGQECERLMKEGLLVPVEITLQLLRQAMDEAQAKRFLVDGFPRAVDQALSFEEKIGSPSMVLYLECSLEEMERRLLKRAETSGRSDDNIDTIRKRFQTFLKQSKPVVDHYQDKGANVHQISSIPPPDEVYETVHAALKSIEPTLVPGLAT